MVEEPQVADLLRSHRAGVEEGRAPVPWKMLHRGRDRPLGLRRDPQVLAKELNSAVQEAEWSVNSMHGRQRSSQSMNRWTNRSGGCDGPTREHPEQQALMGTKLDTTETVHNDFLTREGLQKRCDA